MSIAEQFNVLEEEEHKYCMVFIKGLRLFQVSLAAVFPLTSVAGGLN